MHIQAGGPSNPLDPLGQGAQQSGQTPPTVQAAPHAGQYYLGPMDMSFYNPSGRGKEITSAYNSTEKGHEQIQAAHEKLLSEGYVFVGYHGAQMGNAQSIVDNGLTQSNLSNENGWSNSVYTSVEPETAAGYASGEGANLTEAQIRKGGTLLRAYMKREDFERLHENVPNMADPAVTPSDPRADYILSGPIDGEQTSTETAFSASASQGLVLIPSEYGIDNSNGSPKPVLEGKPITDPARDAANDDFFAAPGARGDADVFITPPHSPPGSPAGHRIQPLQPVQGDDDGLFYTPPTSPSAREPGGQIEPPQPITVDDDVALDGINPVSRRHPSGYITPQTDLEAKKDHTDVAAAAMAAHEVYKPHDPNHPISFTVDGQTWTEVADPKAELGIDVSTGIGNPLKTSIFRKAADAGEEPEYIVAYKGTDQTMDWFAGNLPQGAGLPALEYQSAKSIALQVANSDVPGLSNATFAGHSLGGGLATQAHILTGNPTYAFNPAALSRDTISWARQDAVDSSPYQDIPATWSDWGGVHGVVDLSMDPSSGLTTIVAEGDVLDKGVNRLAGGFNDLGDKFIVKTDPAVVNNLTGVDQHDMGNVLNGISNQYGLPTYEGQVVPDWGPPTVPYNEGQPDQTTP